MGTYRCIFMALKWTFSCPPDFSVSLIIRLFYVQIHLSWERSSTRCFVRVFPLTLSQAGFFEVSKGGGGGGFWPARMKMPIKPL